MGASLSTDSLLRVAQAPCRSLCLWPGSNGITQSVYVITADQGIKMNSVQLRERHGYHFVPWTTVNQAIKGFKRNDNNQPQLPIKTLIPVAKSWSLHKWLICTSISIVGMATSFSFGSLIRGQLLGSLMGPRCFLWAVTSWYARSMYTPQRFSTARTREGFSERSCTIRSLAAFTLS